MKKSGSILSFIIVLSIILTSCGNPLSDAAEGRLKEAWKTALKAADKYYSAADYGYSYSETAAENFTWENIVKARAACTAAEREIKEIYGNMPETLLSEEDIKILTDSKINAGELNEFYILLKEHIAAGEESLRIINGFLYPGCFIASQAAAFGELSPSGKNGNACFAQLTAAMTDKICLILKDTDLWEFLSSDCKSLAPFAGAYEEKLPAAEEKIADLREETAENTELIKSYKESSAGETEKNPIPGIPCCFPAPGWEKDGERHYFRYIKDLKEYEEIKAGDELSAVPDCLKTETAGVSREAFDSYAQTLKDCVEITDITENEDGSITLFSAAQGYYVKVLWTEEKTVLTLSDPLPEIIPADLYKEFTVNGIY